MAEMDYTLLDRAAGDEQPQDLVQQIRSFCESGEYEKALAVIEDALKQDPGNGDMVFLMGLVYRDMGKKIQAIHWLRKAEDEFGMTEVKPELMKLYRTGIAGPEFKAQAEAYFGENSEEVTAENTEAAEPGETEEQNGNYPGSRIPFYTAAEYREFISKHSKVNKAELLKLAEEEGRGFGFMYMSSAYDAVENNQHFWLDWYQLMKKAEFHEIRGPKIEDIRDALNRVNRFARHEIAVKMHEYVEQKNGKIDCWPDPESDHGFVVRSACKDVELYFDYFKEDYRLFSEDGKIMIDGNRPNAYNNGFEYAKVTPSKNLTELNEKIKNLENTPVYTEKNRKSCNRCKIFAMIPLVFLLLNVLATYYMASGSDGSGLAGVVQSVFNGAMKIWNFGIIGKVLMFLPIMIEGLVACVMMLVYKIAGIFGKELIAAGILAVASVVLGFVLRGKIMDWFGYEKTITAKMVQESQTARRKAEELKNGAEMKRLVEEETRKLNQMEARKAEAEKWHKAWYEAYLKSELS